MPLKHLILTAFHQFRANKSRAVLTMLGIIVGITAIILIMSLGAGAKSFILSQVQGMGSKTIAVVPGREPTGPSDVAQMFTDSLKERDLDLLKRKENVPNAETIMPMVFGGETGTYGSETYRLTIFGATDAALSLFDIKPERGDFFSQDDVKTRSSVVVIGDKVRRELFGDEEPIGKKIKIKGKSFRVIGVFPKAGQISFFNFDEMAFIPYTTAQQYIFGIKYFHRFIISADEEQNIDAAVLDIKRTLRDAHGLNASGGGEKDDFFVETQQDVAKRLGSITTALTVLLSAIAAISLVVGGIGIMNIMLVSVTERTREIGLRKALGATEQDILFQFLIEAALLTVGGGIIGILLGASFSFLAALAINTFTGLEWSFSFPVFGAALGVVVSGVVGLIFGISPARRAAKKDPIEALRWE